MAGSQGVTLPQPDERNGIQTTTLTIRANLMSDPQSVTKKALAIVWRYEPGSTQVSSSEESIPPSLNNGHPFASSQPSLPLSSPPPKPLSMSLFPEATPPAPMAAKEPMSVLVTGVAGTTSTLLWSVQSPMRSRLGHHGSGQVVKIHSKWAFECALLARSSLTCLDLLG